MRGYVVRQQHRAPAPSSLGRPLTPPRSAAADSLTMAHQWMVARKWTRRLARLSRARAQARRGEGSHQEAAAAGVPQWPEALPGILNFRVPDTPCGSRAHIAMLFFPHMMPMADFPLAKCDVLRRVVVGRLFWSASGWRTMGCYEWSSRRSRLRALSSGCTRSGTRVTARPRSFASLGTTEGGGGCRAARRGARRSVQGLRALHRGSR